MSHDRGCFCGREKYEYDQCDRKDCDRRSEQPAIRLVRPLQQEYLTIGYILELCKNNIYSMTEEEFIHRAMKHSHGSMNPNRVRLVYLQLMQEAGIVCVKKEES